MNSITNIKQVKTGKLPHRDRFAGLMLGSAIGDSIGLPAEGLRRSTIAKRWPGEWRHRFVFGRGMISDDTEHMLFVAQSLLAHPRDVAEFQRALAWKLRCWLIGLPAGVGLATLRAILKLWVGVRPEAAGVRSAGNGPSMRSAIIGAFFWDQPAVMEAFVRSSTLLTHTDPRAETAALAVAKSAAWIFAHEGDLTGLLEDLSQQGSDDEWRRLIEQIKASLKGGDTAPQFAARLGLSHVVSGYSYHSVPVALYAWLRHPTDFRTAIESVIQCGGDTDTIAAITGAFCGATAGVSAIPKAWLDGLSDWPRSKSLLERVAGKLYDQRGSGVPLGPVHYFWPGLAMRNVLFLLIVLLHGFRRLLPPY